VLLLHPNKDETHTSYLKYKPLQKLRALKTIFFFKNHDNMKLYTKGKIILLGLFLCALTMQSQEVLWEKSYGGKHAEQLLDALATPDYGFILAGSSISNKNGNKASNNKGDLDYWLWKMNEKGDLDWQKSFGGSGVDLLQSILLTTDAGFILGGTSTSSKGLDKNDDGYGDSDIWIIKLDAKGGILWQKTMGGEGHETLQSIAKTADGGYILGGSSTSDSMIAKADAKAVPKADNIQSDKDKTLLTSKNEDSRGGLDYWIIKLNSKGTIEWQKTIGGSYQDQLKSIAITRDGGYIVGGYSNSMASGEKSDDAFGQGDYWILKLDDKGNIQWQKTIGGDGDDNLTCLLPTRDGGYLAGGSSSSSATNSKSKSNGDGSDFWIVKLDHLGNTLWQETYNYGKHDVLSSILENSDGTCLLGGYAQGEGKKRGDGSGMMDDAGKTNKEGINDYIALKINNKGEKIWDKTVGSKGDEVMRKLFETRDGGYLLAGTSSGEKSRDKDSGIGAEDFWIVKLKDKTKPEKVKTTLEALPNPAVTFTNIIVNYNYNTGTATLYDLSGRQIHQTVITGEHTVPIDLSNLPQGVYIVDVKTDMGSDGVKVIRN
jgi:Secretion system C-terminal sorting domain